MMQIHDTLLKLEKEISQKQKEVQVAMDKVSSGEYILSQQKRIEELCNEVQKLKKKLEELHKNFKYKVDSSRKL